MLHWRWLGRVPYGEALALMATTWEQRVRGEIPDTLLLLEHPPVLTVGRSRARGEILASPSTLADAGIEVHQADRGGRVTYHGPGQLVGYPIFAIGSAAPDAARFARRLGEIMVLLLGEYELEGRWEEERPGVWVGEEKIGAVGIRVESGVSRHGFAFNVDPDLEHYRHIIPCGIAGGAVTSLSRLLGRTVSVDHVAPRIPPLFAEPSRASNAP